MDGAPLLASSGDIDGEDIDGAPVSLVGGGGDDEEEDVDGEPVNLLGGAYDSDDSDAMYFEARGISHATAREILWCATCGEGLTDPPDDDYWNVHEPEVCAKYCLPCESFGPAYEY